MQLIRVEHQTCKHGPYRTAGCVESYANGIRMHDALSTALSYAHSGDWHPSPDEDGAPDWQERHMCGFATEGDMLAWFDGWLDKLHEQGYVATTYEVSPLLVHFGRRQVMFDPNEARVLRSVRLTTMEDA